MPVIIPGFLKAVLKRSKTRCILHHSQDPVTAERSPLIPIWGRQFHAMVDFKLLEHSIYRHRKEPLDAALFEILGWEGWSDQARSLHSFPKLTAFAAGATDSHPEDLEESHL